jgi:predicted aspartyl protease
MGQRACLLLLSLLPLAAGADARETRQDPAMIAPESLDEGHLLELGTIEQRLTVPVSVGAQGPYPFIIDTGAERSVVSRELAASLGLAAATPVMLTSMTGTRRVDTVLVPDLSIRSIGRRHTVQAPALFARNIGAQGMLGIDTLADQKVSIDFEKSTMTVRPSVARKRFERRDPNEIVVRARSRFGQLIVTDAFYRGVRIQVVLDTGSQVTMGNGALRRRIGTRAPKVQPVQLTGVTGDTWTADYTVVPDIKIGSIAFGAMPVAFADVAPFERFGLTQRPALLLGMDSLRSFRRVDIDFANREVRFLLPPETERRDWRPPF